VAEWERVNTGAASALIQDCSTFIEAYRALALTFSASSRVGRRQVLKTALASKMADNDLPSANLKKIMKTLLSVYKRGDKIPIEQLGVDIAVASLPDSATWRECKKKLLSLDTLTEAEFDRLTATDAQYVNDSGRVNDVSAYHVQALEDLKAEIKELRSEQANLAAGAADDESDDDVDSGIGAVALLAKFKALQKTVKTLKKGGKGSGKSKKSVLEEYKKGATKEQKKALEDADEKGNCFACAKKEGKQRKCKQGQCPSRA
jgi:hypothetical protein